ncbi:OLC1v1004515C1 [Oldenlandia corymbosa var. corymbosa]|uniref:OLC1v1004515C1 n=1 Tax=Oldenlandia corymbosa var. corymbosa TaxID=529605 RepID=A0AAV1DFX9_OLDCO|nr:OLC1v1004515C1 [Oldenlandia corymbosa var. corymbosa]
MDLSDNQLEGSLPLCLGNLSSLAQLHLRRNTLGGELPSELGNLKQLTELDLSGNYFKCPIPSSFGQLSMIDTLILNDNQLFGTIPPALLNLTELGTLDVSYNSLSGELCGYNLAKLKSLRSLRISKNQFLSCKALMVISLANNQLTGKIPTCLGNLRQLGVLDLANNSLSGQIPYTLGNLVGLLVLHLNGNKLFGELPSTLKNLIFLVTFDLGNNQLWGLIPDWIAKEFSNLRFLRLQSNNFHGNISVNLCQLPSLQVLNLGENKLDGSIPACLGNLSMMLSDDSNSDVIFSSFYDESFWRNNLHGEIPDELMDLESLQNLNMSNNNLSGKIPERIDNLKHLESLDLSVNQLSGTIPQILANIDALSYLNLSFNNLVGPVPSGNHFDTLNDPSIYEGNIGLCGKPLTKSCPNDSSSRENTPATSNHKIDNDADKFEFSWFYSGIGPGFVIGSLGFFGVLHLKKSWRHAYFRFLENVCDKVRVSFVARISRFQRRSLYLKMIVETKLCNRALTFFQFISVLFCSLCNLTSRVSMDVSYSQIEGPLPQCVGNFTLLWKFIWKVTNSAEKLPSEIGNLKHLIELELSKNPFKSSIVYSIRFRTSYNLYNVSHNSLTGKVSESHFCEAQKLKKILHRITNLLPAGIPCYLGNLTIYDDLDFCLLKLNKHMLNFVFILAREFGPDQLARVIISRVRRNGFVPILKYFNDDCQSITIKRRQNLSEQVGHIHKLNPIQNIGSLIWFSLTTRFSVISSVVCAMFSFSERKKLHLMFTDRVPPVLKPRVFCETQGGKSASSLTRTSSGDEYVYGLNIDESVPSLTIKCLKWISGLASLRTLHFSNTNLSESLDWLSQVDLDLRNNNFRGRIPDMFGKSTSLTRLDLYSNTFDSLLPNSFCNVSNLVSMELVLDHFLCALGT